MKKVLIIVAAAILSFAGTNPKSESGNSGKASIFLIPDRMPHLTKLIKKHWRDKNLNLSQQQKKELIKIRKRTVSGIMKLKKEITKLENEIVKDVMVKSDPNAKRKLKRLAALKAKASAIHIDCIIDTKKVLNEDQLSYLLNGLKER